MAIRGQLIFWAYTLIPTFSLKGEGAKNLAHHQTRADFTPSPVGEGWGEEINIKV